MSVWSYYFRGCCNIFSIKLSFIGLTHSVWVHFLLQSSVLMVLPLHLGGDVSNLNFILTVLPRSLKSSVVAAKDIGLI